MGYRNLSGGGRRPHHPHAPVSWAWAERNFSQNVDGNDENLIVEVDFSVFERPQAGLRWLRRHRCSEAFPS
jgi:hypothetical protein